MEMGTETILVITGIIAEIIMGVEMVMEAGMETVGEIMAEGMVMEAGMTTEIGAMAGMIKK